MRDSPHSPPEPAIRAAIDAVAALAPGQVTLVVGATDTGKTSFVLAAVNALAAGATDGDALAVVDCDIGQSEIGPPAVVGLSVLRRGADWPAELRTLSGAPYTRGAFIGALSPAEHAMEVAAAAATMTRLAGDARWILVDTPGMVTGSGLRLLGTLIRLLRPALVIAFARDGEIEPLLRPAGACGVRILRAPVSPDVARKTSALRATRRMARFARHLRGSAALSIGWDDVALDNTRLSYGAPLRAGELTLLGQFSGGVCLHAERFPEGLVVAVFSSPVRAFDTDQAASAVRASRLAVTTADRYENLLCGLDDGDGRLLGIGVITKLDFARRRVNLMTPVRDEAAIARVALGHVRVRPDGREITAREA